MLKLIHDTATYRVLLALVSLASLALVTTGCPEECPKGQKDCACNEGACNDGLTCKSDKCVTTQANCPDGSEGCPCYANSTCDDLNGTAMECQNNICVESAACPVGTLNCPCSDGLCQGGLRCNNDVCEGVALQDGILVGAANVRACDVMFDVGATNASKVVFDASVVGKFRKEGSRMVLSFTARADAALTGAVAQVQDSAGAAVDISAITPSVARCFDRLGAEVNNPQLTLR